MERMSNRMPGGDHRQLRGMDIHVAPVLRAYGIEGPNDVNQITLMVVVAEKLNPICQLGRQPDRLTAVIPLAAGPGFDAFLHVGIVIDVNPSHATTNHVFADRFSCEADDAPVPGIRVFHKSRAAHIDARRCLSVR